MSFSIKIENGDIATEGDHFQIVNGTDKLVQDLTIWLKERYNSDRFHPAYGSTLESYIGGVIGDSMVFQIESEVNRVLRNYQALQVKKFRENPSSMSPSEILAEVTAVVAEAWYDRVEVMVYFKTYQGTDGQIRVNVSTDG